MFGAQSIPSPEDSDTPRQFGLIAGILCFCFFCVGGIISISESKNSTAVVGYVFLPFYAAFMAGVAFLAGWCIGYFLLWYRSPAGARRASRRTPAIAAALFPVILVIVVTGVSITLSHRRNNITAARQAARNPDTAPEDLEKLAVSTNEYVLGNVAGNPKLSVATLRRLANHGGYLVEGGLAHNPRTPQDILSRLARSGDEYTRGAVAANPSAPVEVLADLSNDVKPHVRWTVALNPFTPQTIVESLLEDPDETVRRMANSGMFDRRRPRK